MDFGVVIMITPRHIDIGNFPGQFERYILKMKGIAGTKVATSNYYLKGILCVPS